MNILVFDDNEFNRRSAELTLTEHNLVIVETYDGAESALIQYPCEEKQLSIEKALLKEAGFSEWFTPSSLTPKEKLDKYWEIHKAAEEKATVRVDFDVVMTDLMVPASGRTQGPEGKKFIGQEMPLGTTLALLAITRGIKNVAVVSNMSHHDHPAVAAFDRFESNQYESTGETRVPGLNVVCTNHVYEIAIDEQTKEAVSREFLMSDHGKEKYPETRERYKGSGRLKRTGIVFAKDWSRHLQCLLGEKVEY